MKALEQVRSTGKLVQSQLVGVPYAVPASSAVIRDAQGQLQRRPPLSRTHSAPLPLGGHLLNQPPFILSQQEALLAENKKLYLKQVGSSYSLLWYTYMLHLYNHYQLSTRRYRLIKMTMRIIIAVCTDSYVSYCPRYQRQPSANHI